jgi:hypothetical protein
MRSGSLLYFDKVLAFVASTTEFTGGPGVADGASHPCGGVFGDDRGRRSAVGVPCRPWTRRSRSC